MRKFKEALSQIQERAVKRSGPHILKDTRFKNLAAQLTVSERALNSLEAARARQDLTPQARRDLIREASDAAFEQVSKSRKKIQEEATRTEQHLMARAREVSNFKPNGFAGELRRAFSKLDAGAKVTAIMDMIKDSDGPGLASILDAPGLLTGVSKDDRTKYSTQFFQATVPELMATRAAYEDLAEHVLSGIKTVEDAASESDPEA